MSKVLKAIRLNCLDCSGGNRAEVKNCEIPECPLYPYRMGKNPFTRRKGNILNLLALQRKKGVLSTGLSEKTGVVGAYPKQNESKDSKGNITE